MSIPVGIKTCVAFYTPHKAPLSSYPSLMPQERILSGMLKQFASVIVRDT
jgi:hypothetical protein